MSTTGSEKPTLPFLGKRPSLALKLAPVLQAGVVIWGLLHIVYTGLNFLEVRLLQDRQRNLTASSQSAVVNNIHHLGTVNVLIQIAFWPTLILSIVWSHNRRSRPTLRQQGELFVGSRYREIAPGLAAAYWVSLAIIVVLSALSVSHTGETFQEILRVRRFVAFGAAARIGFAVVCFEMIRRASQDQRRREAVPVEAFPVEAFPVEAFPVGAEPSPAAYTGPTVKGLLRGVRCPTCGARAKVGALNCPACGAQYSW